MSDGVSNIWVTPYIKLIRVKQWVKNSFVLSAIIFSSSFLDTSLIVKSVFALVMFCIASSCVYIVNDVKDIEKDRLHHKKSVTRPLASGEITIKNACVLLSVMYSILLLMSTYMPSVGLVILCYILLNFAYTYYLKEIPVIDIFCVASGFVLRVYAGALAISVDMSSWMFITTLCLALYLASIKRRQELLKNGDSGRDILKKYTVELVSRYAEMSALGALIFYSLYAVSERPNLSVTIPIVIFGLFRYWYIVETLDGGESPTDSLYSDAPLILTVVLWVVVCLFCLWPN
ncbi:TPA: decaprenyl-phosphate phosphoribosyltransferase [Enterobacter asburiae]|uniref:decaprenyl-phosphate phosphoribosyltransferase n=1 Tax=Enterobacter asburiae TaxID=61645 RepID=UPI000F8983D4|nr:decaprenyl-phosphate phosphoribosyltransferase [Enterobacter asburiae]RTP88104.1 decaprenyl-phosphate phosphoribosyltransferase [Enterobacter asburiae]HCB1556944.1 decaprenyl-phosphate phosphoribosyltransferase [Enterobacter asburiae]